MTIDDYDIGGPDGNVGDACAQTEVCRESAKRKYDKKQIKKTVMTVVMVVVIVVCVAPYVVEYVENGAFFGKTTMSEQTGSVAVTTESIHAAFTADYEIYIDDEKVDSFSLGPGGSHLGAYSVTVPEGDTSKTVTICVKSTGGGSGDQNVDAMVTVFPKDTASITLNA
jgi:hypothetical protein